MSTEPKAPAQGSAVAAPLSIRELTALLIKHHELHEGQFDLLLEYQFGVGAFGPNPQSITPGVMVGLSSIGLTTASAPGPLTVDAAQVNPKLQPMTPPPGDAVKKRAASRKKS